MWLDPTDVGDQFADDLLWLDLVQIAAHRFQSHDLSQRTRLSTRT
jgi:hypothetical protein